MLALLKHLCTLLFHGLVPQVTSHLVTKLDIILDCDMTEELQVIAMINRTTITGTVTPMQNLELFLLTGVHQDNVMRISLVMVLVLGSKDSRLLINSTRVLGSGLRQRITHAR